MLPQKRPKSSNNAEFEQIKLYISKSSWIGVHLNINRNSSFLLLCFTVLSKHYMIVNITSTFLFTNFLLLFIIFCVCVVLCDLVPMGKVLISRGEDNL